MINYDQHGFIGKGLLSSWPAIVCLIVYGKLVKAVTNLNEFSNPFASLIVAAIQMFQNSELKESDGLHSAPLPLPLSLALHPSSTLIFRLHPPSLSQRLYCMF